MKRTGIAIALPSAALFGATMPLAKGRLASDDPWVIARILYQSLGAGIGLAAAGAVRGMLHLPEPGRAAATAGLAPTGPRNGGGRRRRTAPVDVGTGPDRCGQRVVAAQCRRLGDVGERLARLPGIRRSPPDRRNMADPRRRRAARADRTPVVGARRIPDPGYLRLPGHRPLRHARHLGRRPGSNRRGRGPGSRHRQSRPRCARRSDAPGRRGAADGSDARRRRLRVRLALHVVARRDLGTARTAAYFSVAPVVGVALAVVTPDEPVSLRPSVAAAPMAFGVWPHLAERHEHEHAYVRMSHSHRHRHDEGHRHAHGPGDPAGEPHAHWHEHRPLMHRHPHYPDLHHGHRQPGAGDDVATGAGGPRVRRKTAAGRPDRSGRFTWNRPHVSGSRRVRGDSR